MEFTANLTRTIAATLVLTAALFLPTAGCNRGTAGTGDSAGANGHSKDGDDGHDHGAGADPHAAHAHPAQGPHGGHVVELGSPQHHAELLHDEATGTLTVHLLDAEVKNPVRIAENQIALTTQRDGEFVTIVLTAVTDGENTDEGNSHFAVVDAALCDAMLHTEKFIARLSATIDGASRTGTIEHTPHEHEGHAHDGDGH